MSGIVVEVLAERAAQQPDRTVLTFLADGERESETLTFGRLERRARAVGAALAERCAPGDRVLLLYPPGLEFAAAFFGCLYAGVLAVPVYPPRASQRMARLRAIAADCGAALALTTSALRPRLERWRAEEDWRLALLESDAVDESRAAVRRPPAAGASSLAFLQYTSGSTGDPKGVMVRHGNLLANLVDLGCTLERTEGEVLVSWLPTFHDMGLLCSVLHPVFAGHPCYLMSPAAFLQKPLRWLVAISRYRATTTFAPNFAYDLCVERSTAAERAALDLRSWRCALNGAEPIRWQTLVRFAEAFGVAGFDLAGFCPGYGLAEATLKVCTRRQGSGPATLWLERRALAEDRVEVVAADDAEAQPVVSCGTSAIDTRVAIVDPESREPLAEDRIGEIWVAGSTVAQGYWGRPEQSARTFGAALAGTSEGPFLRTGDLGFLHAGELYVTGRRSDRLVIRGMNVYPQDVEATAAASHPLLRAHGAAAFGVPVDGEERLVVAVEATRARPEEGEAAAAIGAVRRAVSEEHELSLHAVALLAPGQLPTTSSGKVQRRACRAGWQAGTLRVVAEWRDTTAAQRAAAADQAPGGSAADSTPDRVAAVAARALGVSPENLDWAQPFATYGISSAAAVALSGLLQEELGRELPATLLYDHPTLERLVAFLGETGPRKEKAPGREEADWASRGRRQAPDRNHEPIAVIGIGCRFPGAPGPEALWGLLASGGDAVGEPPPEREALMGAAPRDRRWPGGYLAGVDLFDAELFGISPREARQMDPQQRLLLEVAWEALEDAGLAADRLAGSATGVWVGISTRDYERLAPAAGPYAATGNATCVAANRLSYVFDLRGPSVAVDTACSSSLVAVHAAVRALRAGECDLALAAGVNLLLDPEVTAGFAAAGMMAPDGRCKAFDAAADGYVRSEGCGVVVLRRLGDALARREPIACLVLGTAVNQDGKSNGLTAPNGAAQAAVVRAALADAGVPPATIGYVEAHGTGTALGDPIEIRALAAALGEGRAAERCGVGSLKTNLGHMEAAAGIGGLIKAALALRHGELPPHLHLKDLNPEIQLPEAFFVPAERAPWPATGGPRRAGVSSFGFGGTNAHAVLEEAPAAEEAASQAWPDGALHALCLSARSEEALRDLAARLAAFLETHRELPFGDVCYSAATGRAQQRERLAVVAGSTAEAARKLAAFGRGEEGAVRRGRARGAAATLTAHGVDEEESAETLQERWLRGERIDFERLYRDSARVRVRLPGYPFERQSFWVERQRRGTSPGSPEPALHPLLHRRLALPLLQESVFETRLDFTLLPLLGDHRVGGEIVVPAAHHLATVLAALPYLERSGARLGDVHFPERLALSDDGATTTQLVVSPQGSGATFKLISLAPAGSSPNGGPPVHVLGRIEDAASDPSLPEPVSRIAARCRREMAPADLYDALAQRRIDLGPSFRSLERIQVGEGEALGELRTPQAEEEIEGQQLHPGLLDACFQLLAASVSTPEGETWLPAAVGGLQARPGGEAPRWCHARLVHRDADSVSGDLRLLDAEGVPVVEIAGFVARRVRAADSEAAADRAADWLYELAWRPRSRGGRQLPPDFLPDPAVVAARLGERLERLAADPALVTYGDALQRFEDAAAGYALGALRELGVSLAPGERFTADELADGLGVAAPHRPLFESLLRMLEEDDILRRIDSSPVLVVAPPRRAVAPAAELAAVRAAHPEAASELALFERCGAGLARVLRGACDPLQDLLFPGGDASGLAAVYRDSPGARALNALAAEALDAAVARLPRNRPLRILEIGAGTGGTTAALLPRLPAARTRYAFTDVSTLFTERAARELAAYDFVTYGRLDVELPPEAQGWAPGAHDVVVAANVLHATRELREALANVRRLLAPGGMLVLVEGTRPLRRLDLIFGLTAGWWRFADREVRASHPLLPAERWRELLAECGFAASLALESPATAGALSHQAVLVAWADGREESVRPAEDWLILADRGGLGERLAERVAAMGDRATMAVAGDGFERLGEQRFRLDPRQPEQLRALLDALAAAGAAPRHVVHLEALDRIADHDKPGAERPGDQRTGWASALHLLQTIARDDSREPPALWLVTRGAAPVPGEPVPGTAQAPLWGLARSAALEHPRLGCARVDLAPEPDDAEADDLLADVLAQDGEPEIAYRGGVRHVARLVRYGTAEARGRLRLPPGPYRLEAQEIGSPSALVLRSTARARPRAGEIEIRACASGLNFRDVLAVLGLYGGVDPRDGGQLGSEVAGEVVEVGEGVAAFAAGDRVVAVAPGAFGRYVVARAELTAPLPPGLGLAAAATLPVAFLTAHLGLIELAALRRGDWVLVHAASGGVGQAALQLARRAGAHVIAGTSRGKRDFLRTCGVAHVVDSRSPAFAGEVLAATGGRGVDVVLSSLAGEMAERSLDVLTLGGRFVDLAKAGAAEAERLARRRPDVLYRPLDLAALCAREPARMGALLRDLIAAAAAGSIAPLPRTEVPIEEAVRAFRTMQEGRHTGKLVLTHAEREGAPGGVALREDATYLITGGLGGLGLLTARWMVERGARRLLLAGRSEPAPAALAQLAALRATGAEVTTTRADVARREEVAALLAGVDPAAPLRGVVHAAGVLDDALLTELDDERFAAVLAPKVLGALNLHELTRELPLDLFVLFSSAAGVLGSPGQANHAAANAFLDALAHHRRALGLPALAIDWGAFADIGAAARRGAIDPLAARGMGGIPPADGLRLLERLLAEGAAQACVLPVDWPRFLERWPATPLTAELAAAAVTAAAPSPGELPAALAAAAPGSRHAIAFKHLHDLVGTILDLPRAKPIDPEQGFFDLGMDSLTSVELKTRLEAILGRRLPSTLAFDYPTLATLTGFVLAELGAAAAPAAEVPAAPPAAVAAVARLSEAEAEAALLAELEQMQG